MQLFFVKNCLIFPLYVKIIKFLRKGKIKMKRRKSVSIIALILAMIMMFNVPAAALEPVADALGEATTADAVEEEAQAIEESQSQSSGEEDLRLPQVSNAEIEVDGILIETEKYSKTFKTGTDTYKTVYSEVPNFYEGAFGAEKEYDNTLVLNENILTQDYYEGTSTDIDVKIPTEIKEGKGVTFKYNGVKVTQIPLSGDYSKSAVLENAILYNDVYDGVDVQYTLHELGLKEDIILNKYVDLTSFSYLLDTHGDTAVLEDGVVNIYKDGDKTPSYTISAPLMTDADGDISFGLTLSLTTNEKNEYILTLTADSEWLSSPDRAYPVRIDPNIEKFENDDIYMRTYSEYRKFYPGIAYGYVGYMTDDGVGMPGTGDFGCTRLLVKFPDVTELIPQGADITSATFNLFEYNTIGTSTVFESHILTGAWSETTTDWASLSGIIGGPTGEGFTSAAAPYITAGKLHGFDVSTVVREWHAGSTAQNGIIIKASIENADYKGSAFFTPYSTVGQNATHDTVKPTLVIEWEYPNPVAPDYSINNTDINLRVISEANASGKLQVYGVFADGLATPGATVNYALNDSSLGLDGSMTASYSKLFPTTKYFEEHFPAGATKYDYPWSNWQTAVPLTQYSFDTNYWYTATATKDGVTGNTATSDNFLIYKVKSFDTLTKIANYYGTTYERLCVDNRAIDGLVIENNTIIIIDPKKNLNTPYNPGELSEGNKKEIDSMLIGRGKHCEFGYEPVNINTGNFVFEASDVDDILRTYNSKAAGMNGLFGRGWSFEYDEALSLKENGDVTFKRGDGSTLIFTKNADGTYSAPAGYYLTLTKIQTGTGTFTDYDGTNTSYPIYEYEITDKSNTVKHFNSVGLMTKITDEDGFVTELSYDDNYSLSTLITPQGRTYTFTMNNGYVSEISLPNGKTLKYGYDDNNNLSKFTDANGNTTTYFYDGAHRMLSYKDANGVTVNENVYDSEGRVVKQTDGNGGITIFEYSENQTKTTDANGNVTVYTYDENFRTTRIDYADGTFETKTYDDSNNLQSVTDCNGTTTSYTYDENGNVTSETRNLDGAKKFYEYNSDNKLTKIIDFDSKVTTFVYDENGDLVKQINNDGTEVTYSYNEKHQVISETNAKGNTTQYTYDGLLLSSVTDALGGKTEYFYDSMGNVVSTVDGNGNITRFTYDSMGGKLTEQTPDGAITTNTFDKVGNVVKITDPKGFTYSFTYDPIGNMLSSTDNEGNVVTYTYDGLYNKTSETDALGNVTTYTYDCKSRVVSITDPESNVFTYSYDGVGNLLEGDNTTYTYDLRFSDAIASLKQALSNAETNEYNAVGLLTEHTDKSGAVTSYSYDDMNRLSAVLEPTGLKISYVYDVLGNITEQTDNEGRTTKYEYDALSRLTKITYTNSGTVSYTYDGNGNILTSTDANGNVTTYTYDSMNRVTTAVNALGGKTEYVYDLNGNLVSETLPNGAVTTYEYNSYDLVSKVIDANGNSTCYVYDANENLIAEIDANGNQTLYGYTKNGYVEKLTDKEANAYLFDYDKYGNTTKITAPNGAVTTSRYDLENRVVEEVAANGLTANYVYNEKGQLTNETTNAGTNNIYTYDKAGRLISATNAKDATVSFEYDLSSNVVKETSALGRKTSYTYDLMGNLVSTTNAVGETMTYTYDLVGNMTEADDRGADYTYTYDALGNMTSVTNPKNKTRTFTYDSVGNLLTESDYKGQEYKYGYDLIGNLLTSTTRSGGVTSYTYDKLYNVVSIIDPEGREVEYEYTKNSNMSKVTEGGVVTAEYSYDSVGNLTGYKNGNGNTTEYTYDLVGNQTSIKDPLENVSNLEYNLNSQIEKVTNPNGSTVEYDYNEIGELTKKTSGDEKSTYTYDLDGNVSGMTDIFGQTVYVTDELGRLKKQTLTNGTQSIQYTYNHRGNLYQLDYPNGSFATYDYDFLDQIFATTDISGNSVKYTRDANQNIIKITRDNGTYTEITYNEDDCVTSVVNKREYQTPLHSSDTEIISSFTYEYDLSGLIQKETATGDGKTIERLYVYDDRCQIIAVNERVTTDCGVTWNVQDTFYTYDNAGNCIKEEVKRSSTTLYYTDYDYNSADQLTKKVLNVGSLKATTNYGYDENGNLIKESNSYNMSYSAACKCIQAYVSLTIFDGDKTYEYDNENRLVASYDNGTLIQAILYDGNGNRAYTLDREDVTSDASASKIYNGLSSFAKDDISFDKSIIKSKLLKEYNIGVFASAKYELTGYVTDLTKEYSQVLLEYGATGKVNNIYSYADDRVSAIINGKTYYYLNDGRGSVSELTTTCGSTATSYRYDIYGKTFASNDDVNNPYQYNAEYTDSTTGLQYLRARYYNANTHRFQTKDTYQGTTTQPITRNNYAYANNNPVNFVDPSGHVGVLGIIAGGAILGAVVGGAYSAYSQYKSTGKISLGQTAKDAAIGAVVGGGMAIIGAGMWTVATSFGAPALVAGATSAMVSGAWGRGAETSLNNKYNPQYGIKNPTDAMFDSSAMLFDGITGGLGGWAASKIANMQKSAYGLQKIKYCDGSMANVADDGIAVIEKIDISDIGDIFESGTSTKPNQVHHYATNKSKTYTPQLEEIANRYGLDLDDAWNKDLLPHQGRHPNVYHEYVLDSMKQFDNIAQGDKDIFLKLFDNLKNNVKSNPDMLYKDYWK